MGTGGPARATMGTREHNGDRRRVREEDSMTDVAVVMKALDWLKANEQPEHDELLAAFERGDVEAIEEIVAGCPDRVTGREVGDSCGD